jgi:hypothetical protein
MRIPGANVQIVFHSYETASSNKPELHSPRECRAYLPRPQLGARWHNFVDAVYGKVVQFQVQLSMDLFQ